MARIKTAEQRIDERQAYALLDAMPGVTLTQCVEHYMRTLGRAVKSNTRVEEVVEAFLKHSSRLSTSGRRSQATYLFYEKHLLKFSEALGQRPVADLKRADLESYLDGLQVGESTRHGAWRAIRAAVRWAARTDPPMIPQDITEGIKIELAQQQEIAFLSVEEVTRIMQACHEVRHGLALMAFAGVRVEEIQSRYKPPLMWQHVDRAAKIVRIPAANSKTRRSRILEALPDNLWAWLEDGPAEGPILAESSETTLRRAKVAAGYARYEKSGQGDDATRRLKYVRKWPNSALRHTFATYHVAWLRDPGRTSLILGHEGKLEMLYRHYRGLATQAQAEQYFAIRPK